jgi:hypothetical protein
MGDHQVFLFITKPKCTMKNGGLKNAPTELK